MSDWVDIYSIRSACCDADACFNAEGSLIWTCVKCSTQCTILWEAKPATDWKNHPFPWELTDVDFENLVKELDRIVRDPPMVAGRDNLPLPCGGCGELSNQPHKGGCPVAKIYGIMNHYQALRKGGAA